MIEIKSRERALEVFGPIGLTGWDWFMGSGYDRHHTTSFGAVFIRPEKLKPLTDAELEHVYASEGNSFRESLMCAAVAYHQRMIAIKEQEK